MMYARWPAELLSIGDTWNTDRTAARCDRALYEFLGILHLMVHPPVALLFEESMVLESLRVIEQA